MRATPRVQTRTSIGASHAPPALGGRGGLNRYEKRSTDRTWQDEGELVGELFGVAGDVFGVGTKLESAGAHPVEGDLPFAKLGARDRASWPLTRTRLTVPLSVVTPRTTSLPWVSVPTEVITVAGGRSSTGSSGPGKPALETVTGAQGVIGPRGFSFEKSGLGKLRPLRLRPGHERFRLLGLVDRHLMVGVVVIDRPVEAIDGAVDIQPVHDDRRRVGPEGPVGFQTRRSRTTNGCLGSGPTPLTPSPRLQP